MDHFLSNNLAMMTKRQDHSRIMAWNSEKHTGMMGGVDCFRPPLEGGFNRLWIPLARSDVHPRITYLCPSGQGKRGQIFTDVGASGDIHIVRIADDFENYLFKFVRLLRVTELPVEDEQACFPAQLVDWRDWREMWR